MKSENTRCKWWPEKYYYKSRPILKPIYNIKEETKWKAENGWENLRRYYIIDEASRNLVGS